MHCLHTVACDLVLGFMHSDVKLDQSFCRTCSNVAFLDLLFCCLQFLYQVISDFSEWHCADPWSWSEKELRRIETPQDTVEVWSKKVVKACNAYNGKDDLVGGMAKKIKHCLAMKGGPIDD